jgi:predicted GNAT family N-acyltransferase
MRIRTADFDADYAEIRRIRFAVFVDEQRVPESIEIDERDGCCIHLLAFDDGGEPIGTARIDVAEGGKIGRLAVAADKRRQGVGAALMRRLHDIAKQHALDTVWCHAQIAAVPFYESLGYRIKSEPFYEADIEHVTMERGI